MRARGIFQWNQAYPSAKAFNEDVDRKELFILEHQKALVGCVALSDRMDAEYEAVTWLTPNRGNRYVHRLAVHPDFQGLGFAQKLMDFAEQEAALSEAVSIRLDTFSRNRRNQTFYEKRGYQRLGAVYFPNQSAYPFYCYERILSPSPRE